MNIGKISGALLALSLAATSYSVPAFAEDTQADEALGVWVRTKKDWLVEFKMCADDPALLCGEVIAGEGVDKGTGESVIGVQMLYNLARHERKDDRWVGTMYNPGDGNEYAGTVRVLDDGRIKMSGCMMKIMCRSEKWPRASEEAAAAVLGTSTEAEEVIEAVVEEADEIVEDVAAEVEAVAEDAAAPEAEAEEAADSVMDMATDAAADSADSAMDTATDTASDMVEDAVETATED